MKLLKRITFVLLAAILCVLTAATIIEKEFGSPFVSRHIYQSPTFVALWLTFALSAAIYLLRRRRALRPASCLLHIALLIILCGAFVT